MSGRHCRVKPASPPTRPVPAASNTRLAWPGRLAIASSRCNSSTSTYLPSHCSTRFLPGGPGRWRRPPSCVLRSPRYLAALMSCPPAAEPMNATGSAKIRSTANVASRAERFEPRTTRQTPIVERIEPDTQDGGKSERPKEGMENPESSHQNSNQQGREEPHASGSNSAFSRIVQNGRFRISGRPTMYL